MLNLIVSSVFLFFLCGKNTFAFALSAALSLTFAAATPQMAGGGISRVIRRTQRQQPNVSPAICDNSVALSELPACHFGGKSAQMAFCISE